jgi:hypothetical protein
MSVAALMAQRSSMGVPAAGSFLSGMTDDVALASSSGPYDVLVVSVSIRIMRLV